MNARGISVFYGSDDPLTALAEVRPPVGSQVVVARFEITRPLRLLDFVALEAVSAEGSIFDPGLSERLERAMFLRSLTQRITRPVMPDDEAFEYQATQAVADFLATGEVVEIDGILFPSVQVEGASRNVVLFHKASRVEGHDIPAGTDIRARSGQMYEEGWEVEYEVFEEVPPARNDQEADDGFPGLGVSYTPMWGEPVDPDPRPMSLRIDTESVSVHTIGAVSFRTSIDVVRRRRWEKWEPEF